jgi:hypothetical protein
MLGLNGSALPKKSFGNSEDQEQDLDLQEHLEGIEPSAQIKRSSRTNLSGHRSLVRQPNAHRGPKPLLPRSLKEALQLASLLSKSRLIPKGFENPEACLVGILYGMEVGLSPIAALQRMAIIDGRPTIWGDAALALVEASGLLVRIEERIEINGSQSDQRSEEQHQSINRQDTKTAICSVQRSGRSEPITRTFSIDDAKRAGLWQKPGPWTDYPDRMLMMRARAFALRDAFPDVLMGLYLKEEFEGVEAETRYAQPELGSDFVSINSRTRSESESGFKRDYQDHREDVQNIHSERTARAGSTPAPRRAPPPPITITISTPTNIQERDDKIIAEEVAPNTKETAKTINEVDQDVFSSPSDSLDLFDSALACAQDTETLEEIREEFNERIDQLDNASLQEAGLIFLRHEKRIRATEETFADDANQSDDPSEDQSEEGDDDLYEGATGRIGKGSLSPHRTRRRFSTRPRKGLTLAALNARRKIDLLKYLPRADTHKEEGDE